MKLTCKKHNRILIGKKKCMDCEWERVVSRDIRLFGEQVHFIGKCGAISYETQGKPVCCECHEWWSTMKKEMDEIDKANYRKLLQFLKKEGWNNLVKLLK